MTITVVIADDQAMVREGFGALLNAQADISVVGSAADGRAAVDLVVEVCPDVVLMDVRMPVLDGLGAARELAASSWVGVAPKILMLTTFDVDDYIFEALRIGVAGFMLKDAPAEELVRAVHVVAAGDALLAPSVTRRLIANVVNRTPRVPDTQALQRLTPRETEVLGQVAQGLSNAEIAAALYVSEQTVKTHVSAVLSKLGLRDRAQAVVFAYENGVRVSAM